MNCFKACCQNIFSHSTSYLVLLLAYGATLYDLWMEKKNISESIVRTIVNFIPFVFGIIDIIGIQVLNICRNNLKIKQNTLLSKLDDEISILEKSIKNKNAENSEFLALYFKKISKIKDIGEIIMETEDKKKEEMEKKEKEKENIEEKKNAISEIIKLKEKNK